MKYKNTMKDLYLVSKWQLFLPSALLLFVHFGVFSKMEKPTASPEALADQAIMVSFNTPTQLNQCAAAELVSVTVENITDDLPNPESISNIRGRITLPSGVRFQNFDPLASGANYDMVEDTIRMLDLAAGASVNFTFEIQADCDF